MIIHSKHISKKSEQPQFHIPVWTNDTSEYEDFKRAVLNIDDSHITDHLKNYKPIYPLSLHYVFSPRFFHGPNNIMLFLNEIPDKPNYI